MWKWNPNLRGLNDTEASTIKEDLAYVEFQTAKKEP